MQPSVLALEIVSHIHSQKDDFLLEQQQIKNLNQRAPFTAYLFEIHFIIGNCDLNKSLLLEDTLTASTTHIRNPHVGLGTKLMLHILTSPSVSLTALVFQRDS
jgi:hypothetical protein